MNELISPEYKKEMERLHSKKAIGSGGGQWTGPIKKLCIKHDVDTLLDYGCGQRRLGRKLAIEIPNLDIREYDPGVEEVSALPSPADIVVATDVMEHIEPRHLSAVLEHIQSLARQRVFMTVATGPAKKKLSDGRNAHLIQADPLWWFNVLCRHFDIEEVNSYDLGFTFVGIPKKK